MALDPEAKLTVPPKSGKSDLLVVTLRVRLLVIYTYINLSGKFRETPHLASYYIFIDPSYYDL